MLHKWNQLHLLFCFLLLLCLFCAVIILAGAVSLQRGLHILSAPLLFEPWDFRIYLFLSPLNGLEADQRRCSLRDGQWRSLLLVSNASGSQCSVVIRKSSAQQKRSPCVGFSIALWSPWRKPSGIAKVCKAVIEKHAALSPTGLAPIVTEKCRLLRWISALECLQHATVLSVGHEPRAHKTSWGNFFKS